MKKLQFQVAQFNALCEIENSLIDAEDKLCGPLFDSIQGNRLDAIKDVQAALNVVRAQARKAVQLAQSDVQSN